MGTPLGGLMAGCHVGGELGLLGQVDGHVEHAKRDPLLEPGLVDTPRRFVEAWGEIERKQKNKDGTPVFPAIRTTITGVWDTKVVPQNSRKTPVPNGAWVYLKED